MEEAVSLKAEIIRLNSSGVDLRAETQEVSKLKEVSREEEVPADNCILRRNKGIFVLTF